MKIREIRVTNSMTGKKEVLTTRVPGKLTFYSCGPTVYGLIHVGNLRAALTADLFFRYFKRAGYDVTYVRNFTDVDDKIIIKANQEGTTAEAIARKYTQEVEKDYALAGLHEPTHKTTVTGHMNEIIAMIEKIIANGKAYVASDGEVIFSVADFEGYGRVSRKKLEDLEAGARVEVSAKKKNPYDFTLWKPAKPGEPSWPSPWCAGRPGWHIECSAMASKWLGDQIDVHHGGEDLLFPHHENEAAQTEAACGQVPFVKYWLHNAFLTMSKEKMSKSLGNVTSARDFLSQFGGEFTRFLLLSAHYRSVLDFGEEAMDHALQGLSRIYEAKAKATELLGRHMTNPEPRAESVWGGFLADVEKARVEIDEQFANDFNTPGVLAAVFSLVREFNRVLSEPMAQLTPSAVLGAKEFIRILEEDLGGMLGFGRQEPSKALEDLEKIRVARAGRLSGGELPEKEVIELLIQQRLDARKAKNFAEADRIRAVLDAKNIVIKDNPTGTTWNYK